MRLSVFVDVIFLFLFPPFFFWFFFVSFSLFSLLSPFMFYSLWFWCFYVLSPFSYIRFLELSLDVFTSADLSEDSRRSSWRNNLLTDLCFSFLFPCSCSCYASLFLFLLCLMSLSVFCWCYCSVFVSPVFLIFLCFLFFVLASFPFYVLFSLILMLLRSVSFFLHLFFGALARRLSFRRPLGRFSAELLKKQLAHRFMF